MIVWPNEEELHPFAKIVKEQELQDLVCCQGVMWIFIIERLYLWGGISEQDSRPNKSHDVAPIWNDEHFTNRLRKWLAFLASACHGLIVSQAWGQEHSVLTISTFGTHQKFLLLFLLSRMKTRKFGNRRVRQVTNEDTESCFDFIAAGQNSR
ncbi:hypothetical protein CDAR_123281 [Caerostris darwini]|uniref:Uncharacterized protein n=1 Tax=Caerostris darwini TaxID=1538125 RepID=A0AAV4QDX3_9ARAC|nr:hypothetical protein CDAR_123281 [Caerostris darwini]